MKNKNKSNMQHDLGFITDFPNNGKHKSKYFDKSACSPKIKHFFSKGKISVIFLHAFEIFNKRASTFSSNTLKKLLFDKMIFLLHLSINRGKLTPFKNREKNKFYF